MNGMTMKALGLAMLASLALAGCSRSGTADSNAAGSEASIAQSRSVAGGSTIIRPQSRLVTLPEGTILVVRTTNALSTQSQHSGEVFTAHLAEALLLDGREIAGKGAEVEGRIVDANKGGRVKDVASIAVQLTRLRLSEGNMIDISTSTLAFDARTTKAKDATKIGVGSGVGAAIGAIAGGGKGAAIGAAAGAGAGTGTVLATRGAPAVIPSESVLNFTLRSPAIIAALR